MDQQTNLKTLKFRALAEKRVSTVIKAVRQIGNLSRKATYASTPAQVEKIFKAIRAEVDEAEAKFGAREPEKQGNLFTLDD
jgi:hypothetical protein